MIEQSASTAADKPKMYILFTDQAEYYFVCSNCYHECSDMQWSGHTRSHGDWRGRAHKELERHQAAGKGCEWCDAEIGGGGWVGTSATKRRDQHRLDAGWKVFRACAACEKRMHECTAEENEATYRDELPFTCECGCVNTHVYTAWIRPDGTAEDE